MQQTCVHILLSFALITIHAAQLTHAVSCPENCSCSWIMASLSVKCTNINSNTIPDFGDMPVEILDLSNNELTVFPTDLRIKHTLTDLDLSNNLITGLDCYDLLDFTSLRVLNLNYNNITSWLHLCPSVSLLPASSLQILSLVGNDFNNFGITADGSSLLMSTTLLKLDLSNCNIRKITDSSIWEGLTALEELRLANNFFRDVGPLEINSLKTLDLSNCHLGHVYSTTFSTLPSLLYLNLSKNSRLKLLTLEADKDKTIPIKRIDLSFCNMEFVNLINFPNLTNVILRNNLVKTITADTFCRNLYIEKLDLSHNSISHVYREVFAHMKQLRSLDLSYNIIAYVERDTFKDNEVLTILDLSSNYIQSFNSLHANSLASLNLSSCEIVSIAPDALLLLPHLVSLDLSSNIVTEFPEGFGSTSLENLDLSGCRLSRINNNTFAQIPRLSRLSLRSNRFTNTFRIEHFNKNRLLHKIWLGDNPWACVCDNHDFYNFHAYVVEYPVKAMDRDSMRCASPENLYGMSWEEACYTEWYQKHGTMRPAEKVWTILMSSILILSLIFCGGVGLRKFIYEKKLQRDQRELESNIEQQRNIARYNRTILEQEALLNAPDPRESSPPCYEDAILMPRLKKASKSLNDISNKRNRRGISAFRSEEVLDTEARSNKRDAHTQIDEDDEISRLQSYDQSPYRRRKKKLPKGCKYRDRDSWGSLDEMVHFQFPRHSPYLRRDRRHIKNGSEEPISPDPTTAQVEGATSNDLGAAALSSDDNDSHDNKHFSEEEAKPTSGESSPSDTSDEFDFTSSLEKEINLSEKNLVIVHSQSGENSL